MKSRVVSFCFCMVLCGSLFLGARATADIQSLDTGLTITRVSTAKHEGQSIIVANSYEGSVLGVSFQGKLLWRKDLSGIMNHDLYCADLTGDGRDEILTANADGSIYCLNSKGELLWQFQPNEVPMISVCVVRGKDGKRYVAGGGHDKSFYWLSAGGELIKEVSSSTYKTPLRPNKKWIDDGTLEYDVHVVNHLRPIPQADGSDVLLLNAVLTNADQTSIMYQFAPLGLKPLKTYKMGYGYGPIGDLRVRDPDGDGKVEVLIGTSGMNKTTNLTRYNPYTNERDTLDLPAKARVLGFGYRVVQGEPIADVGRPRYFTLVGQHLFLAPPSLAINQTEILEGTFSFNDFCVDPDSGRLILASAQSGGSQVHILDPSAEGWKDEFESLKPKGKIQAILDNTEKLHAQLELFEKPAWEREPITTYLMSPPDEPADLIAEIRSNYKSPVFLGHYFSKVVEEWDRSKMGNEAFSAARDNRKTYTATQEKVVEKMVEGYNDEGLCAWGGHGTDPFYYQASTLGKIMRAGQGKKSVFIWPELTILYKKDFPFAVEHLFEPFAEAARQYNSSVFLRNKHNFWQANIYSPEWARFLSGEFADVAIPSMEETQDMTMELSLAGRLGVWASGAFDSWGTRCARDNPSIMRSRQHSHQNLPNHFLRNAVFHISYGAEYINNFSVNSAYSDYMSVLWELIAKGALYVPKRDEILSFNPVHLSMTQPDGHYLREGNSTTTAIRYDKEFHPKNPFVFGRLDGAWSGAAVTEWDFSRYAAGVRDRRQNFLAPYNRGLVLITPPQAGVFADKGAVRGKLVDHLHPLYRNILSEYISDGRDYISADGTQRFPADRYHKKVEQDIERLSKKLPLTVSGEVAWVVAQTSPTHLRLTLIDGGYINPSDKSATIQFHAVQAQGITDLLSGESFDASAGEVSLSIPCGLFRFLDIELAEPLAQSE